MLLGKLNEKVNEQNTGSKIRSRAMSVEQGENTKYFHNLEKQNIFTNTLDHLKRERTEISPVVIVRRWKCTSSSLFTSFLK